MTAVPMVGDVALEVVTFVRHVTRARLAPMPVVGLAGDVQQRLGRRSHEVELDAVLVGETAFDTLQTLQTLAQSGDEVSFSADISTALAIEKMVVVEAVFSESAGRPNRYEVHLRLCESPPLPEPASLDAFGDFGGFDTDIMGELGELAGKLQDAMDAINDAVGVLTALASLGDLNLDNPLSPLKQETDSLSGSGKDTASLGQGLRDVLGGGGP